MDKRKGTGKGKAEEAKFATADGKPLPLKRPRSTPDQGAALQPRPLQPESILSMFCVSVLIVSSHDDYPEYGIR